MNQRGYPSRKCAGVKDALAACVGRQPHERAIWNRLLTFSHLMRQAGIGDSSSWSR
jgi:hypothetical protein